ncbi:MAG: ABC transporter permease, partial [Anaerolineales bacterium]
MSDKETKPTEIDQPNKTSKHDRAALIQSLLLPVLAVFTGLVIGAIAIIASGENVFKAYGALFSGSFGSPQQIIEGIRIYFATGETKELLQGIYPFTESLVAATPYIFGALAVAVGFRCGLFNIGAEGQVLMGALGSAFIGYSLTGLPAYIHLPLALLGGILGGAIWGMIPGYLKARFGAHEVVNTIMMNWIAFKLSDWLLNG